MITFIDVCCIGVVDQVCYDSRAMSEMLTRFCGDYSPFVGQYYITCSHEDFVNIVVF